MNKEKNAIIKDGWVICPYCTKKNMKLSGKETIKNLRFRCKASRRLNEHFFMIDNIESEE